MNISLLTVTEETARSLSDDIAIIISLISLVATIILAIVTYWQNQKLKIVDLEANYFTRIYQDFLCSKIPEARVSMRFLNGRLEGDQVLIRVLNEMRRDSLYFKYADESFYEKVVTQLQLIEDYVVNVNNNPQIEDREEKEFSKYLTTEIQRLYQIISKRYHGQSK